LALYQSSFFTLPMKTEAGHLTHNEVVDQLDTDTVSYSTGLGFDSTFSETHRISIRVPTANYDKALAWMRNLIYNTEFDVQR
jgi:hypothetical protein